MKGLVLCLAQGLFVGRIPVAPGSFGSLLGLLWVAALLATQSPWMFGLGLLAGIGLSVWACGRAEEILGQKDPGSVVLDEIIAMPICYAGWLGAVAWQSARLPPCRLLLAEWWWTAGILIAFRFFDILKPWPVRQSQSLPKGWGVTVDDVLAAGYVNLVVLLFWTIFR